jgi:hypothetical protein
MSTAQQLSDRQREHLLKGHVLLRRRNTIRYWLRSPQELDLINQRLSAAESEGVLPMTAKELVTLLQVTQ